MRTCCIIYCRQLKSRQNETNRTYPMLWEGTFPFKCRTQSFRQVLQKKLTFPLDNWIQTFQTTLTYGPLSYQLCSVTSLHNQLSTGSNFEQDDLFNNHSVALTFNQIAVEDFDCIVQTNSYGGECHLSLQTSSQTIIQSFRPLHSDNS